MVGRDVTDGMMRLKLRNAIYDQLSKYRRQMLDPLFMTDQEYARLWQTKEYTKRPFRPGDMEIYTDHGERVRSKSEKMIADKALQMTIPYRYEYPLWLEGYGEARPDFVFLNVRTREEFSHEHFGMLDNLEYLDKALSCCLSSWNNTLTWKEKEEKKKHFKKNEKKC